MNVKSFHSLLSSSSVTAQSSSWSGTIAFLLVFLSSLYSSVLVSQSHCHRVFLRRHKSHLFPAFVAFHCLHCNKIQIPSHGFYLFSQESHVLVTLGYFLFSKEALPYVVPFFMLFPLLGSVFFYLFPLGKSYSFHRHSQKELILPASVLLTALCSYLFCSTYHTALYLLLYESVSHARP
uniref:Uncharacterized protein n=1 Tax=Pipistrellus kuhlii TaxID=59472 RepID=A0A7J7VUX6_PIPKU|nr:hypothetical protein mPipKuh1_008283 [Pipistrellus kuhlii]